MRNMKLFDKIELTQQSNRAIHFATNETELIKSYKQSASGGSYVVDFKLELEPINDKVIKVLFLPSEETNECIPHIFRGVQRFVEALNSNNISMQGFQLKISNCVIHPVDFKPTKYEIFINLALHRLSFYKGIKTVKNNEINFSIIKSKSINEFLHSSKNYSSNYSSYIIKRIYLPCRGLKSHSLLNNYDLEKKFEDQSVDFKVFSNYSNRHGNYISIYTLNDINSINTFNSIIEEILMYKSDIYSKNIDLTGFDIFIGQSDFKYENKKLGQYLYWNLLSLTKEKPHNTI